MSAIEKPPGPGKIEKISLDSAAGHLLEECRMVLPGIQALFGFQLIAVFNQGFGEKLSHAEQTVHLAALLLVALAAALVMTPAAIHRKTQAREVSARFVWVSSTLVLASMFPLALGLSLDVYLISRIVLDSAAAAVAIAAALLAFYFVFWSALPRREARKLPQ